MKSFLCVLILLSSFSVWSETISPSLTNPQKIQFFFDKLTKDNLDLVNEFYHADVDFIDPVGAIKGADKVKTYYKNMYQNVDYLKFEFSEFHESKDTVVAVWKMILKTPKLNSGDAITVEGNSVVKFDASGKATYHRDYFDMGVFVYEHIPVMGFFVKKIKNKFKIEE
jgi:hypothetical protein